MNRTQIYQPIKKEFIPLEEGQEIEVSVLGLREILQSTEEESDIPTSTGKTKNGIVPIPIIVNGTNTHNSGDVAKQGSVRANILGIIPFAKKLFSKKKEPAPAPRKPLPEGELVISFYDSAKELLSTETFALTKENQWETLSFATKAEEKGYVSAYIQGKSAKPVSFDNFQIKTRATYTAKLYQENHYYPFGMNMRGLESQDAQTTQNKDEHLWQYNSMTERENSFELFWDETPFRNYDMQLGRLWGVDKLATKYVALTPFHYSFNNPISLNDPTGLEPSEKKKNRQRRRSERRKDRFAKKLVKFEGWLKTQNAKIEQLIQDGSTTAAFEKILEVHVQKEARVKKLSRSFARANRNKRFGKISARNQRLSRTSLGLGISGGEITTAKTRVTRGGSATTSNPISENVFFNELRDNNGNPIPDNKVVFSASLFMNIVVNGGSASIDIFTANDLNSSGEIGIHLQDIYSNASFSGAFTSLEDINPPGTGKSEDLSSFISPASLKGVSFSLRPNGGSVSSTYRLELSISYCTPFIISYDVNSIKGKK